MEPPIGAVSGYKDASVLTISDGAGVESRLLKLRGDHINPWKLATLLSNPRSRSQPAAPCGPLFCYSDDVLNGGG